MKNKGFTLIELLVVIAIIGLIASVVLVAIGGGGIQTKAKIAKILEFSSSVQHVLGAYAVGVWSFDEGSGATAKDGSGYNNNGTLNNFVSPNGYVDDTPHKVAGTGTGRYALSFDGVNDYVNIGPTPMINYTNDFTIETWAYPRSFSNPNSNCPGILPTWIISQGVDVFHVFRMYSDAVNGFSFLIRATASVSVSTGLLSTNQWYHLAGVYDKTANRIRFYKNGLLVGTGDTSALLWTDVSSGNLRIGWDQWSCSNAYFNGLIDEVRIYEKALTFGQIQQRYAEGLERHQNLATIK